jgi:hypothetical protein
MKGLWGGRVGVVVKMREREQEKYTHSNTNMRKSEYDKDGGSNKAGGGAGGVWSDGDTDGGKTTEDENDSFGGIHWSGRMQKKIESWAKCVIIPRYLAG